jgi:exodeoxyribonuclease VII large subunit
VANQSLQDNNSDPDIDPISIDRLTSYIEQALLQTPQLRQIWVSGEVSSATHHPSGIYFNLNASCRTRTVET